MSTDLSTPFRENHWIEDATIVHWVGVVLSELSNVLYKNTVINICQRQPPSRYEPYIRNTQMENVMHVRKCMHEDVGRNSDCIVFQ